MSILLYLAAALMIAVGAAHSYLGERYILMRLFRRSDLPKLFGGTAFTIRTLRFVWHVTTLAWWGFAAIFVLLAEPPIQPDELALVLAATMLTTTAAIIIESRGRHLAWLVFLATGLVALYAAFA